MMVLAGPGGVTRATPCARPAPLPFSSPPPRGPGPQLPPDTHALSTSSRTFHMFNIVPRAGRAAASLACSPRTRDTSTPGLIQAGSPPLPAASISPSKLLLLQPRRRRWHVETPGQRLCVERKCPTFRRLRAGHNGTRSFLCAPSGVAYASNWCGFIYLKLSQ